jgi:hypothetical protein
MSPQRREALFLGTLLVSLALVQGVHLSRPFLRHHESVGAEISKHARNHLKFGLAKTYGLKLDVSGPSLEPYGDYKKYFYSNHPPLPALLMAAAFAVSGVHEASYRIVLILFSLASVALFRRIAARILPSPGDRAATVIFAALPMFAYYSIVTALQVTALTAILAAILFYLRWRDGGGKGDYVGLLAAIAVACYCAWCGYYVALVLVAAHVRTGLPRTRAVLALGLWNVAVFCLYLLHLWVASPPDLDPIRKLLSAGLDRATPAGLSLFGYLLGEGRELAVMMTVPALLLAVVGLGGLRRATITPNERLIAALCMLGLDEGLFARLSSQHEYFSYPLVVFIALAAGLGVVRIAARRPAQPVLVPAALVGLVLLQAGVMLQRRLTTEGGYEFYYRLGLSLRDRVPPRGRVLLLTDNIPFYTPYYGDVYTRWYDAANRQLLSDDSGPHQKNFGEPELEALLQSRPAAFDVIVTADKESAVPKIGFLQRLNDAQLKSFGVETERSPRRAVLERLCGAPVEHGGFLFWTLK